VGEVRPRTRRRAPDARRSLTRRAAPFASDREPL
jgi:hypothetical protein